MSLDSILQKYRTNATSERDKGNMFEKLMLAYLQTDTFYATKFKTIWLWNDFPAR